MKRMESILKQVLKDDTASQDVKDYLVFQYCYYHDFFFSSVEVEQEVKKEERTNKVMYCTLNQSMHFKPPRYRKESPLPAKILENSNSMTG